MRRFLGELRETAGLREPFCEIRGLPPAHYDEQQWTTLRHLFTALPFAVAELKKVFAERGQVDFVELGIAAREVLTADHEQAASTVVRGIRHLLVDEFQDTSRRQHELICALVRNWQPGDGRTCFFVGDPMQSIYMFRQAEVELFEQVSRHGLPTRGGRLMLESLRLVTNFRSSSAVVEALNPLFAKIFPEPSGSAGGVEYFPSIAQRIDQTAAGLTVHPGFFFKTEKGESDSDEAARERQREKRAATKREANAALEAISRHLPAIQKAREKGAEFTLAVLGRNKLHLLQIAQALRDSHIAFRSVEMEKLRERQEILDLQALTRALSHPFDRVAWLAVLRAPWCGLTLGDLHLLCGSDGIRNLDGCVLEEVPPKLPLLDDAACRCATRTMRVLEDAIAARYQQTSFSSWIERAWRSLGGPECVDATGYENALVYFRMLDRVSLDGIETMSGSNEERLDRLWAQPDPETSERCGVQLMTIHKAKGLGFNVVIVPGLERPSQRRPVTMLHYLERMLDDRQETLVVPIGKKGEDTAPLYKYVSNQLAKREGEELKRLLYVSCTRAREDLHLFGTATVTKSEFSFGSKDTLLSTAWPALEGEFQLAHRRQQEASANGNLLAFPMRQKSRAAMPGVFDLAAAAERPAPLRIRRLSPDWEFQPGTSHAGLIAEIAAGAEPRDLFDRPDAGLERRLLGVAVHALMEQAAKAQTAGAPFRRTLLEDLQRSARAVLRNGGLPPKDVEKLAPQAVAAAEAAFEDSHGRWILSAHREASSETSWTGVLFGELRSLRVDRIFLAGPEPLAPSEDCLWIVDYKTATCADAERDAFFVDERRKYSPQLEAYGEIMRIARKADQEVRLALYYPLMQQLVWW